MKPWVHTGPHVGAKGAVGGYRVGKTGVICPTGIPWREWFTVSRQDSGTAPVMSNVKPRTPPEQRRVHTERPRTELPRPTVALVPGVQLRRAVDTALLDLQNVSSANRSEMLGAMRRVNDNLHGALAHTAAIGETCMVAGAVQAVHAAEYHLEATELSQARVALTTARERLTRPRDFH